MKKLLLALGLALTVSSATATTFEIGALPLAPAVYSNTATVLPKGFKDYYNFTFPVGGFSASGSAVTVDVQNILGITGLTVDLWQGNTLLTSGNSGKSSWVFNTPLTPGNDYSYTVYGFATGSSGGVYTFLTSAAPVPELSTLALSLLGIGVLSIYTKRKKF